MFFTDDSPVPDKRPRVLVVGAGFGGMEVAWSLQNEPVEIMLLDRNNYHTFQPLLYQVVTAGLDPEDIAWSIRDIFQDQKNFSFRMGTVTDVNFDKKTVHLRNTDPIDYDYLVLAAGAAPDYFGVEGAEEHSLAIKDLMNAVRLRSHILHQFENVEKKPERVEDGALNFVIVGGGPTGVETAGALVELFDKVLRKDFPELNIDAARVILVEMNDHLLDPYDESLQEYTENTLRNRGVEVKLESSVVKVSEDRVEFKSGEVLPAHTLIWAAGVKANPLADQLHLEQGPGGRIIVNDDLSVPGHPDSFVIGDMAAATDQENQLEPQLATVAIQGGAHVSQQILRRMSDQETEPFEYNNPGKMATVGVNAAVAELPGGIKLSGFPAWFLWVFIHIMKLVGFRSRFLVFMDWVYNYFTYNRASRLIYDQNFNGEFEKLGLIDDDYSNGHNRLTDQSNSGEDN